mgnify:CR=1 FL=1
MNLDSYKVLKLINGEMIICEINSDTDQSYEIELNLIEKYNPLLKTFSHTSNINNISF